MTRAAQPAAPPIDRPQDGQLAGSRGCPHAQVYVSPCGHGLLIWSSQSHCSLVHVSRTPGAFLASSMTLFFPASIGLSHQDEPTSSLIPSSVSPQLPTSCRTAVGP